jgi:hypothetical protein
MGTKPPKEVKNRKKNTLLVDGNALFKTGFSVLRMSTTWSTHRWTISIFNNTKKMLVDDLYHRVYVFWDGNLSGKLRYDFINHIKVTVVKTL